MFIIIIRCYYRSFYYWEIILIGIIVINIVAVVDIVDEVVGVIWSASVTADNKKAGPSTHLTRNGDWHAGISYRSFGDSLVKKKMKFKIWTKLTIELTKCKHEKDNGRARRGRRIRRERRAGIQQEKMQYLSVCLIICLFLSFIFLCFFVL